MIPKKDLPYCPVALTVELIGSKWKLLILRDLLSEPKRFSELQKSLPGISQKVLAASLRAMEGAGLLDRTVHAETPPRVDYSLNALGASLKPVIMRMAEWGREYSKARGLPSPDSDRGHIKEP